MDSADYLRVELPSCSRDRDGDRLDDFLRRRSKIALVVPEEDIRSSPGLREVAEILFGEAADRKIDEHFSTLR